MAVPLGFHLDNHQKLGSPRWHKNVQNICISLGISQPIIVSRLHRKSDQRLMVRKPSRLHVTKNWVLSMGDSSCSKNWRRTFSTKSKIGKLPKRALHHAFSWINGSLNYYFCMGRHFKINGFTLYHLHRFAQHSSRILQLIKIFMDARPVRHNLINWVQTNSKSHWHGFIAFNIFEIVLIIMSRRHPEWSFMGIIGQLYSQN